MFSNCDCDCDYGIGNLLELVPSEEQVLIWEMTLRLEAHLDDIENRIKYYDDFPVTRESALEQLQGIKNYVTEIRQAAKG